MGVLKMSCHDPFGSRLLQLTILISNNIIYPIRPAASMSENVNWKLKTVFWLHKQHNLSFMAQFKRANNILLFQPFATIQIFLKKCLIVVHLKREATFFLSWHTQQRETISMAQTHCKLPERGHITLMPCPQEAADLPQKACRDMAAD